MKRCAGHSNVAIFFETSGNTRDGSIGQKARGKLVQQNILAVTAALDGMATGAVRATDPEVWEQPEEFRPERFLTEEGKLHKPKHFMPFGAGQRMCLGDKIAEMELQLFFTSLLHVFDIENPGSDLPSLQGCTGVTVSPHDFEVNFIPRNLEALNKSSESRIDAWSEHVRTFQANKPQALSR